MRPPKRCARHSHCTATALPLTTRLRTRPQLHALFTASVEAPRAHFLLADTVTVRWAMPRELARLSLVDLAGETLWRVGGADAATADAGDGFTATAMPARADGKAGRRRAMEKAARRLQAAADQVALRAHTDAHESQWGGANICKKYMLLMSQPVDAGGIAAEHAEWAAAPGSHVPQAAGYACPGGSCKKLTCVMAARIRDATREAAVEARVQAARQVDSAGTASPPRPQKPAAAKDRATAAKADPFSVDADDWRPAPGARSGKGSRGKGGRGTSAGSDLIPLGRGRSSATAAGLASRASLMAPPPPAAAPPPLVATQPPPEAAPPPLVATQPPPEAALPSQEDDDLMGAVTGSPKRRLDGTTVGGTVAPTEAVAADGLEAMSLGFELRGWTTPRSATTGHALPMDVAPAALALAKRLADMRAKVGPPPAQLQVTASAVTQALVADGIAEDTVDDLIAELQSANAVSSSTVTDAKGVEDEMLTFTIDPTAEGVTAP